MLVESANRNELADRFYSFYDAVVVRVQLEVRALPRTCRVVLQCLDKNSVTGWSDVQLDVFDVSEYRFQFGKSTFEVLSGGIQFAWRGDLVYVVLDAYPDDSSDLPDLTKNIAYVVGRRCDLQASAHALSDR